jgi:hypothetical protein
MYARDEVRGSLPSCETRHWVWVQGKRASELNLCIYVHEVSLVHMIGSRRHVLD